MKKYYLNDGTEITKDSVVSLLGPFEDIMNMCIKAGIVKAEEDYSEEEEALLKSLAKRLNKSKEEIEDFLSTLADVNVKALFIVLIKEMALMLDNKYDGHIRFSKELWAIENNTFRPFLLSILLNDEKEHSLPLNRIAVFRCKEDAELALNVLKPVIDFMNGK